jgi:N-methylhydantoinase A
MGADCNVVKALDVEAAMRQVEELLDAGVEAISVCLLNAYLNPTHEQELGVAIRHAHPGLEVVLSHEITRRYREYERAVTCVGEAYIRPRMSEYFARLECGLESGGFDGDLFITSSDGGVMGLAQAKSQTLRTLVSGCASGIAGAASLGASCGYDNLICIDMGGTSFDAGIVKNGLAEMSTESDIAGLRLLLPMIELATIGAGGGSVAWVDDVGGLNVGPESAGANPGPACYQRGGTRATFSDAALVSGLLPAALLDGQMKLSLEAAIAAIQTDIAEPLSLGVDAAASAVVALVEARMARLLEEITIGRGHDPRDFTLLAYGGGGPMVGSVLGDLLNVKRVVVPRNPGVFSAWGMQTLDIAHQFSRTAVSILDDTTNVDRAKVFSELITEAHNCLEREGVAAGQRTVLRFIELRYDGQEHTLAVPVLMEGDDDRLLRERFESMHQDLYGFRVDGMAEVVGYQVRAIGALQKPEMALVPGHSGKTPAPVAHRTVTHRESGAVVARWPVYRRESLAPGCEVQGPALVEELTTTVVVTPGRRMLVDQWGNLILEAVS